MTRNASSNNANLIKRKKNTLWNRYKIESTNRRNRKKIDTPNTHLHDRSLSLLFADILNQSGRVKLILSTNNFHLSQIMQLCLF
jgi:hypothetical protein